MSRRAAEEEIRRGAVLVNGIPAEIGQKVDPETDRVEYHGRVVGKGFVRKTYIMLNKPRGYVTTASESASIRSDGSTWTLMVCCY